ncbi:MAG: sigma-70 factor domain-containing protein, partial [Synechococcaceae cyanobacterium]|nr:sigma-70 factor domain-containing protein [Synechococcaceae cyanobacterium]
MARASSTDLVRLYLQDIGRVNLLSQEEELTLARLVRERERLLKLKPPESGDPEGTQAAWAQRAGLSSTQLRQALHRGKRARERMIQA